MPPSTLFLTPHFPLPDTLGSCMRAHALASALATHGPLHLVVFHLGGGPAPSPPPALRAQLASYHVLRAPPFPPDFASQPAWPGLPWPAHLTPPENWRLTSPPFRKILHALASSLSYDRLFIFRIPTLAFAAPFWERCPAHFLDADVAESAAIEGLSRLAGEHGDPSRAGSLRREADALRWIEQQLLPRCRAVFACTPDEAALLHSSCGVSSHFLPNIPPDVSPLPLPHPRPVPRLLFVGNMRYPPCLDAALWFVREIAPLLPGPFHLTLAGAISETSRQQLLSLRPHHLQLNIPGFVDDLTPLYADADLCVLPLRTGSGSKLKLLEALARGRPVITTPEGTKGWPDPGDTPFLTAATAAEFARACALSLHQPGALASLARRAATCQTLSGLTHRFHDTLAGLLAASTTP